MIAMQINYTGIEQVIRVCQQMVRFGQNPAPLMQALAQYGENSTRLRFRLQVGPYGKPWKRSLRAQLRGGKTLTQEGHLSGSITHASTSHSASWGSNMKYARIHQLGGVIRPVHAKALRFRLAHGAWVAAKQVTLPARPYLGLDDSDYSQIGYISQEVLRQVESI